VSTTTRSSRLPSLAHRECDVPADALLVDAELGSYAPPAFDQRIEPPLPFVLGYGTYTLGLEPRVDRLPDESGNRQPSPLTQEPQTLELVVTEIDVRALHRP
jgi:hypothetical protein